MTRPILGLRCRCGYTHHPRGRRHPAIEQWLAEMRKVWGIYE